MHCERTRGLLLVRFRRFWPGASGAMPLPPTVGCNLRSKTPPGHLVVQMKAWGRLAEVPLISASCSFKDRQMEASQDSSTSSKPAEGADGDAGSAGSRTRRLEQAPVTATACRSGRSSPKSMGDGDRVRSATVRTAVSPVWSLSWVFPPNASPSGSY